MNKNAGVLLTLSLSHHPPTHLSVPLSHTPVCLDANDRFGLCKAMQRGRGKSIHSRTAHYRIFAHVSTDGSHVQVLWNWNLWKGEYV